MLRYILFCICSSVIYSLLSVDAYAKADFTSPTEENKKPLLEQDRMKGILKGKFKKGSYAYPRVKRKISKIYLSYVSPYTYFYSECKLSNARRCAILKPRVVADIRYSTEHIVPASVMIKHISCSSRDRRVCSKESPRLNKCLSNPYNLVPAVLRINKSRYNKPFSAVIEPDAKQLTSAGFYVNKKTIVPPIKARAKIAHAYLHMEKVGCFKMSNEERALMNKWEGLYKLRDQEKELIIAYFTIFPAYEKATYK